MDMLDTLLDGTLDQLADIPEYRVYPVGAHKVKFEWTINHTIPNVFVKDKEGKDTKDLVKFIKLDMEAIETVEISPTSEDQQPLEKGAKANILFDLTNERGQGKFKAVMAGLMEIHGAKSPRELIADSTGGEYVAVISHRKNKDKTKTYIQIDTVLAP